MTAFRWTESVGGEIVADGKRLEAIAHGPPPSEAPTIVMLHEGLGCLALWRDFPARLAAATGWGVFAYSRAGYGRSDPVALPRPLDYMTREARSSLPAALDAIGIKRGILLGHSDGASIAADLRRRTRGRTCQKPRPDRAACLHRGAGPRLDCGGAPRLRDRRPAGEARQISRRRRRRVLRLERRVARSRVQGLDHRGRGRPLARPRAFAPGRGRSVRHAGANPRHRGAISSAGEEPCP